jgi:hypothetical protein
MRKSKRNKEGLTWSEWFAAARQSRKTIELIEAWLNGEDPTEWAI